VTRKPKACRGKAKRDPRARPLPPPQPEIVEHYESMLPGIFQALASPDVTVQRRACVALDAFCENLTEELGPYLDRLMAQATPCPSTSPHLSLSFSLSPSLSLSLTLSHTHTHTHTEKATAPRCAVLRHTRRAKHRQDTALHWL